MAASILILEKGHPMMKLVNVIFLVVCWSSFALAQSATYVGSETCKTCHAGAFGNHFTEWKTTLHSKIHEIPSPTTVKGDFNNKTVSMGSSYGNAVVSLRTDGIKYYAKLSTNGPEYEIAYTYGGGWKQRYLVKIDSSYYILPIQWNSKGYLDNSTGAWATYTQATWYKSDGSLITTNTNSFRSKSWDKNCMGCHVSGFKIDRAVAAADTFWVGNWGANKTATDINVGCESCHGPGSLHPANAFGADKKIVNPSKLTVNNRKLEVCGQCHNRASSWRGAGLVGSHEFAKDELNNKYFTPGDSLALFMRFDGTPNASGGPGTWPDLITARQHHQQYQEWQRSAHFSNAAAKMTCFTCHDPHKTTANKHQIRDSLTVGADKFKTATKDNTMCLSCHAASAPFAGITKAMVKNESANRAAIATAVKQHTKHKTYDPENTSNTGGSGNCVSCHLAKTAVTALSYDISSHTFAVITPKKTLDYKSTTTPTTGMLNSCAVSCHRNPAAGSAVPTYGITDASLTNWAEASDIALADTLWRYYRQMFPTSVEKTAENIPKVFALSQNYPNPFNPSTEIQFQLAQSGAVKLVVYNVAGQQVKVLIDQEMDAGAFRVAWSGRNDYGEPVASGVYLYRLEAPTFQTTKKMVLMR